MTGDVDSLRLLLNAGADPNGTDKAYGLSPLVLSAMNGADGCVEALIAAGANAAFMSESGAGPLMAASSKGHVSTTKLLLNTGKVDPLKANHLGLSPYEHAKNESLDEVVAAMDAWLRSNGRVEDAADQSPQPTSTTLLDERMASLDLAEGAGSAPSSA